MTGKNKKIFLSATLAALGLLGALGASQAAVFTYIATLEGAQEVPPNGSPATGFGVITIDDVANTLSYDITFGGLSSAETAAHIHGFAAPGANAGVLVGLPAGNPKVGVWNFMEAQQASLLAGLAYVNIHSQMFPGGEIRGQIVLPPAGCWLNCPGGDGGLVSGSGTGSRSPDLNSDGDVNLVDFAQFAAAYGTSNYCSDFDCSGLVNIADFALFGGHFSHGTGSPGVCY